MKKQLLKKNVKTIHIKAKLSLSERKIANALLFNAYENLIVKDKHIISLNLLCEMTGYNSRDTASFKKSIEKLTGVTITWNLLDDNGDEEWGVSSFLSSVVIKNGIISYRYSQELSEKLYNPDLYTRINLNIQKKLKSSYSLALYENCLRFIRTGSTGFWSVEFLRQILGVDNLRAYDEFKRLSEKILKPSIYEINHFTDIVLEPFFIKENNKITKIKFNVRKKKNFSLLEEEENIILYKLKEYGISKKLIENWLEEYGEEYILEKIEIVESLNKKNKIKSNVTGFLVSAISDDFKKGKQIYAEEKMKNKRKEEELKELKKAEEEIINKSNKKYNLHCIELVKNFIEKISEERQENYKNEFMNTLENNIEKKIFKKDEWESVISRLEIIKFWKNNGKIEFPDISIK